MFFVRLLFEAYTNDCSSAPSRRSLSLVTSLKSLFESRIAPSLASPTPATLLLLLLLNRRLPTICSRSRPSTLTIADSSDIYNIPDATPPPPP